MVEPGWVWSSLLLASAEGRYRSVARLSGVIRAMAGRGVQSVDWNRALSALVRPAVDRAHRELATQEVERLAQEGAAMSWEDVLEEALAERPPPLTEIGTS